MPETPYRSGSRTSAALLCLLMLSTLLTAVGTVRGAGMAQAGVIKTPRASYAPAIEPLAAYQAQTTCSPVAKPGTANFAARLLSAFPTTRSLGIVRGCSVGGRSEHKEGRAFDWGVRANDPADRARAERFLTWLLRTDKYGNQYAMARRLGIQYVIWNRRVWGAYDAAAGWRPYAGHSPHTDHIHISFTWAGGRGRTSFWTGKVGNVLAAPAPTLPVPPPVAPTPIQPTPTAPSPGVPRPTTTPRPRVPAPTPTPIPAPRRAPVPASSLLPGPDLVDETLTLPAAAEAGVLTTGALVAGQAYLIEASGTYQWGARSGETADAECSRTATDGVWRRDRSVHPLDPTSDHLDLYVDGTDLQSDPDDNTGGGCDTRTHTYRWTYVPTRTGRVALALWDPTVLSDNTGALTIRVLSAEARDPLAWGVPAAAPTGVTSPGALAAGSTYVVTVTGTVEAGNGITADAECSTSTTDPGWRRVRSVLPADPYADHLDVLVDRRSETFRPVTDPDGDGCDATGHAYRLVVSPTTTRTINLRVDDPLPSDDTGSLSVSVVRVPPVVGTETIGVNTAQAAVTTARTYLAGQPLRITATGSWTFAPNVSADAECSSTVADPVWRTTRSTMVVGGRYLGDVSLDGWLPEWLPAAGGVGCDPTTHAYVVTYTPTQTGPISLGVADLDLTDNAGTVILTISPTP